MPIRHATPSSAGRIGAAQWDQDHQITGRLDVPDAAAPGVPSAGRIGIHGYPLAGDSMLGTVGAISDPRPLGSHRGLVRSIAREPYGASSLLSDELGTAAATAVGTATARPLSSASALARARRYALVSAATAGSMASLYYASSTGAHCMSVGSGGLGGFFASLAWGCSDAAAVSGKRQFVGLSSSTAAPTNVDPATLTNSIGIAKVTGSANLVAVCAGTTAQSVTDLGASFPAAGLSTDLYRVVIISPSDGGVVYMQVLRYTTGNMPSAVSSVMTFADPSGVAVPGASILMAPRMWATNGATALAVGLDIGQIYCETLL